jgi:hypothetical protein
MTTEILSNGSKYAGEAPENVEFLLALLANEPLDRKFEAYGNFAQNLGNEGRPGAVRFFGNFFTCSNVFRIDTDDPTLIERLLAAIRVNQLRPDYLAQDQP